MSKRACPTLLMVDETKPQLAVACDTPAMLALAGLAAIKSASATYYSTATFLCGQLTAR